MTPSPCKLPLEGQAALFERLKRGRKQQPPNSWQQIAIEEQFAKRTVEHFYMRAWQLEKNADRRPYLVITAERVGRYIHAQATAMPPSRSVVSLSEVDFVLPPLLREIKPGQLPLQEKAALFAELWYARRGKPRPSWKYLAVLHGFEERPLERFYRSAMKLEENAERRPLAQIFLEMLKARRAATPVGRRSGRGPGEVGVGESRAVDRRRARAEARRRARKATPEAEPKTASLSSPAVPPPLHDEQRAAEAREAERQQRDAREHLARAEEEGRWEAEEEQLREGDPLRQLMEVWDPSWGPRPVESPFDV